MLDDKIRDLITDPNLTIQEAYEDTIQIMVEADKLEQRTNNMLASFQRLLGRTRTNDERTKVVDIGKIFIKKLSDVLK